MGLRMESWLPRHRITVHDYHRMAEVGVLAPDARVELIEGEIIDMAPIGKSHQSIVDQLNRTLVRAVGDSAIVRVQGSVRLPVVGARARSDAARARSVSIAASSRRVRSLLVIEVSDSTLRHDRDVVGAALRAARRSRSLDRGRE
jgi:hypothetical protein